MQFFRNYTDILTRSQGKKFEDMLLVKIASKGTSLNDQRLYQQLPVYVQSKIYCIWIDSCILTKNWLE